ncbi:hypothetical protein M011DRAFT_377932, partial [Sporormia fimetaria CBS 119925]
LFSVGQSAAVSAEVTHALGRHSSDLTFQQLQIFQKAEYAGHITYIANMGLSRISMCLFIPRILPGTGARFAALTFAVFSALWAVSGVLVTIFPCSFPHPWEFVGIMNRCIDLNSFINYIGITNIVQEFALILLPLLVWNLRLSWGRTVSVSLVFLSRLSVVTPLFTHLILSNRSTSPPDPTYTIWSSTLTLQLAQNLSIITACLPCLHPFLLSLLSD